MSRPASINGRTSLGAYGASIWDKLVEMELSVDADYQDEGMYFEGTYLNGEDKCWEPEFDEKEEDA